MQKSLWVQTMKPVVKIDQSRNGRSLVWVAVFKVFDAKWQ